MCSCSIFSHFRSFSPWWPLAFLYFLTAAKIFSCFYCKRNWSPFLSLVRSLSLLSSSMQTMRTKVERKTRLCCCLIVPSKSPGGHAIYRPNAQVMLEMQNFITAYVGTDNFLRTKIYWMHNRTFANGHLFSSLRTKIIHDSCLKPLYNGDFLLSLRWPL